MNVGSLFSVTKCLRLRPNGNFLNS